MTLPKPSVSNGKLYLALDASRRGVATPSQHKEAWLALYETVRRRTNKQYNSDDTTVHEDDSLRAMVLNKFLIEQLDKPVRLVLSRWHVQFATIELLMEIYGDSLLNESVSKLANKNESKYLMQLARLQRQHKCYDPYHLVRLWTKHTTPKEKRATYVSAYRLQRITELAEKIIYTRQGNGNVQFSQLSEKRKRTLRL